LSEQHPQPDGLPDLVDDDDDDEEIQREATNRTPSGSTGSRVLVTPSKAGTPGSIVLDTPKKRLESSILRVMRPAMTKRPKDAVARAKVQRRRIQAENGKLCWYTLVFFFALWVILMRVS